MIRRLPRPAAVRLPVQVVGLIEQDEFVARAGEAACRGTRTCHPLEGLFGPLVGGVEFHHLPVHVVCEGMGTRGLSDTGLSVQDQRFFLPRPVPRPLVDLPDGGGVPHNVLEALRPVLFSPVHVDLFGVDHQKYNPAIGPEDPGYPSGCASRCNDRPSLFRIGFCNRGHNTSESNTLSLMKQNTIKKSGVLVFLW